MLNLDQLIKNFHVGLEAVIAERINQRLRDVLAIGLVAAPAKERREARRMIHPSTVISEVRKMARRKGPIQLCPVPRCKNRAAPVFGMVCAKHKDVAKREIREFRIQRRQRAAGLIR